MPEPSAAHRGEPSLATRLTFWGLFALAFLWKLHLATLPGTMDVVLYAKYGMTLARSGFAAAYASDPIYNIPPVPALYSALIATLAGAAPAAFAFLLKLPGILGESIFGVLLWRRYRGEPRRQWLGLLVAFNPVAIPITGFHGNMDSLLAVFLGMALLAAIDDRPLVCGLWFGLAANLKIAPVLLAPAFFFWWMQRGRAWRFAPVAAAVILLGWSPGLVACPDLFLHRVIGYSSLWGTWGISRLLFLTGSPDFAHVQYGAPSEPAQIISTYLKLIVIAAATVLAWRRRNLCGIGLAGTVAAVWTVFFIFAPGGAPQYVIWPVVPLLIYNLRLAVVYMVGATPFMLIFYSSVFSSVLPFDPYPTSSFSSSDPESVWAGAALFLWATFLALLAVEGRRWWNGRSSNHPALPLVGQMEVG